MNMPETIRISRTRRIVTPSIVSCSLAAVVITGILAPASLCAQPADQQPPAAASNVLTELMRQSAQSLEQGIADEQVVKVQQSILTQLQILEAAMQQNGSGRTGQRTETPDPARTGESAGPAPRSEPLPESVKDPSDSNTPPERNQPAVDSDPKARNQQTEGLSPQQRRQLLEGIWGHLPEELQSQILDISDQRPLPKYSDAVRKYYESLSRSPQNRPQR